MSFCHVIRCSLCRLSQPNYMHRMPRVPYQTTPFTIDPSARSTQTFAERYGISPPHSTEDLYDDCSKSSASAPRRGDRKAKYQRVDLAKHPLSQQTTTTTTLAGSINNNPAVIDDDNTFQSTVIGGTKTMLNNTHATAFDVEQKLQVSVELCKFSSLKFHPMLTSMMVKLFLTFLLT